MSIVQLHYTAPVIVEVDLETREVIRVNVADEDVKFDGSNAEEREIKARQIAEKADWPGWKFGF